MLPVGLFVGLFVYLLISAIRSGSFHAAPHLGDGQDYDAIGYNLSVRGCFGYFWDDPEYRRPYEKTPEYYEPILKRHGTLELTTYRPPAFPFILAGVYKLLGRRFAAWRLLNCAIVALAITIVAVIARNIGGWLAALITAGLTMWAGNLVHIASAFLTEGLACLGIALVAYFWFRAFFRPARIQSAILFGLALGGLVLIRNIFVLWVCLPIVFNWVHGSAPAPFNWRLKLVSLATALAIVTPWSIRNISVTGKFMPSGSQAGINLPAGFGPQAIAHKGVWAPQPDDAEESAKRQSLDHLHFETWLAQHRTAKTLSWMRNNPAATVKLMGLHIWQEVKPRGDLFRILLMLGSALGIGIYWRNPAAKIVLLLLVLNLACIAATWGIGDGRLLVPIQPLQMLMTGLVLAILVRQLYRLAALGVNAFGREGLR